MVEKIFIHESIDLTYDLKQITINVIMPRNLGLNAILDDVFYLAGTSLVFFVLGILAYNWSLKRL